MSGAGVDVYEVPVDASLEGLMRCYEVVVPTETGGWCTVEVSHNLVRRSYEVEFTEELLDLAPQALTATIQLVVLAIKGHRG